MSDVLTRVHRSCASQGFVRRQNGRILGGVFSGLGAKYQTDPWALRVAFILICMLVPGSQFLFYLAAWLIVPDEGQAAWAVQPAFPTSQSNPGTQTYPGPSGQQPASSPQDYPKAEYPADGQPVSTSGTTGGAA